MLSRAAIFALTLGFAPPAAHAADLVVWWEQAYTPEEDAAVREIVAAFEDNTGKQVELVVLYEEEHSAGIVAALQAGDPPDFAFGTLFTPFITEWAYEERLVDLSAMVGSFAIIFGRMRSTG